jgi:hypothetical protein
LLASALQAQTKPAHPPSHLTNKKATEQSRNASPVQPLLLLEASLVQR